LGETVQLGAAAEDANGNPVAGLTAAWTSSDAAVATVDGAGLVTAVGNGSVTITATMDGVAGTAAVTVAQQPAAVTVTPATSTLVSLGESVQLAAAVVDAGGNPITGQAVEWTSSDAAVATVDGAGLVTAVGDGTTQVTATSGGVPGTATVVVAQTPAQLAILTQPSGGLEGGALDVQPVIELQDALGSRVASDNSTDVSAALEANPAGANVVGASTATVQQGVATFADLGVSASGSGFTLSFSAGALPPVVSGPFDILAVPATITVDPGAPAALTAFGDQVSLSATARDAGGAPIGGVSFVWVSTNPAIADVDASGTVVAAENGTTQITASARGVTSDPVTITVQQVATSLTVTPELSVVAAGGTASLAVQAFDSRDNPIASPELTSAVVDGNVLAIDGTTLSGVADGVTDFTITSGTATSSGRAAVVPADGFAAVVTQNRTEATVVGETGTDLVVQLMLLRPSGGTGSLGSVQGHLEWDASHLGLTATEPTAQGFTWVPNDAGAAEGTLLFSAFSATGNETVGADVAIADLTFSVIGTAGAASTLDLVIDVVGSTEGDAITGSVQVVDTDLQIGM
jgi:uncharacterized protein YjdB